MATILIVDNDEQYPVMLAKMLKKNNHSVAIANDGEGALYYCKNQIFDLIITDIPNSVSLELIINLINTDSKIPVIAISGGLHLFSSDSVLLNLNAKVLLTKPFTEEQLLDAINVALNQS